MDSLAKDIEEIKIDGGASVHSAASCSGSSRQVTLQGLLDAPTLDTNVLKTIYQFLCADRTHFQTFLSKWFTVYDIRYQRLIRTVSSLFDHLMNKSGYEQSLKNRQYDENESRRNFDAVITGLVEEYHASNCLHNGVLEKLLTLLIARDYVHPIFYSLFHYTCCPGNEPLKAWLLEALYRQELVGYDEARDQELIRGMV